MTDKKPACRQARSKIFENYPVILVSLDIKLQEKYIKDYIKENTIVPYFIYRIQPVKEEIGIDQIRAIKKEITVFSKEKRLFIIYSFDLASIEAQNAILKTLEENVKNNQFVFFVSNLNRVIETIQSRSRTVYLGKNNKKLKIDDPKLTLLINQLKKDKNNAFLGNQLVMNINKKEAVNLIDKLINYFRNNLLENPEKYPAVLKKLINLRKLIIDNNLNPQLTVDNLLIFINKLLIMK